MTIQTEAPVETRPLEPRPKTPREVGEHAARYIEEHGWTQGRYTDDDGHVCVNHAIQTVIAPRTRGFTDDEDEFYGVVLVRFHRAVGESSMVYNDAPERTEAEVLAALRSIR